MRERRLTDVDMAGLPVGAGQSWRRASCLSRRAVIPERRAALPEEVRPVRMTDRRGARGHMSEKAEAQTDRCRVWVAGNAVHFTVSLLEKNPRNETNPRMKRISPTPETASTWNRTGDEHAEI